MVRSIDKALTWPDNFPAFDELETVARWAEGRLWVQPLARKRQGLVLAAAALLLTAIATVGTGIVAP